MDFKKYKENIEEVKGWLQKEFQAIRTGAASAAVLDGVKVEAYGTAMPLNQLANIGLEDAKTLTVSPFDNNQVDAIRKALTDSNLNLAVSVAGTTIRLSFPELTIERKEMLIKLAREKVEEARVSIRQHRDDTKQEIEEAEKDGGIGKDEEFSLKEEMEKITKDANSELDETLKLKEEEINQ